LQEHTKTYDKLLHAMTLKEFDIIMLKGGMRSGKTYGALQMWDEFAILRDKLTLIKIVGMSVPHLKKNIIKPFRQICFDYNIAFDKLFNKQDREIVIGKTTIMFMSADSDNILGDEHDFLYINECNARVFKWDIIEQLFMRTKIKAVCDYNPRGIFWYHTELLKKYKDQYPHLILRSTYKDNHKCPEGIRRKLDNAIEGTYFHRVYVCGEDGRTEGVIFENWRRGKWDSRLPFAYGVDYGHTDPDTIIRCAVDEREKKIYVYQVYYQAGNGTVEIKEEIQKISDGDHEDAQVLRRLPWQEVPYKPAFICDKDAKINEDLRNMGINLPYFAKPRIVDSIRQIQDYEIILCGESVEMEAELNNWAWNDKRAGVPEIGDDHTLDAMRYVFTWLTGGKDGFVKRTL